MFLTGWTPTKKEKLISLPFELRSPYPDDETRTRDITKILEEFIHDNWDVQGIDPDNDVAFGKYGDELLQTGKQITLRCYTFFTSRDSNIYGRRRWFYEDGINIDVYVLNNDRDDQRDPRAIKIMKWLEELITSHEGDMTKGIDKILLRSSDLRSDPFNSRLTHAVVSVMVYSIGDLVEV